jgi:hypothetical protein
MILIFGLRSYVKALAILTLACRHGHVAAHRLVKVTRKFSLFFVPLFPVGRARYFTVCAQCGWHVPWDKETAEAAAQQHGAGPGPGFGLGPALPPDPVAPPLRPVTSLPLAAPTANPGWYPDPAGESGFRYWDGSAWTAAVHEGPVA